MKQWITQKKIEQLFGNANINKAAMDSVALFPKLGIAYNRIKKNANTSIVILLRELETGIIEEREIAKERSLSLSSLPMMEINKLDRYKYFVVIRNPYSRVLSAFLDKFRHNKYKARYGYFDLTPNGFHDFINWLENGGLHLNNHWDLQTTRLLLPLSKYDKVVHFETLRDDMQSFLSSQSISLNEGMLTSLYPSDVSKKTAATAQMDKFYTRELAERVYTLFKNDFDALSYSADLPN